MPTRIELLKQAGFSDGEIGDWATGERQRMQQAGFTDGEIDDEFGVTRPPKEVPAAFVEHLKHGNWFYRVLGAAGEYAQNYFGDAPLGFSPENREALSKLGVIGDLMVPAAKPIDALLRSVPAGIAGLGAGLGQAFEEGQEAALGPGPYSKGKAARDFAQLAQIAALLSGANGPKTRATRASVPNISDGSALALPRAEDFRNAAASIAGNSASFQTEQKLLRLWTEHGIPPIEVAEDALRDRTIAEAIRSDSEKLPDVYAGTNRTTTAAGTPPPVTKQPIERAQVDRATVPAENQAGSMKTEERLPADQNAPEPAPMIAQSRDVAMYAPPRIWQRPFAWDYREPPRTDATGRLLRDIEGRPLRADFVAGRRFAGKADEPLSPDDIGTALEQLDLRLIETPKLPTKSAGAVGLYHGYESRAGPSGDIFIKSTISPSDQEIVTAHEFGHAIDHLSGLLSERLTSAEIDELRAVYRTLRAGPRKALYPQPEDFGYADRLVKRELVAEGLRAYMTNPNYFKMVAPRTAAKVRAVVNESPYLKHVIQFNSLGAVGLAGAGIGNQDRGDQ
jgi:hypothetical protein